MDMIEWLNEQINEYTKLQESAFANDDIILSNYAKGKANAFREVMVKLRKGYLDA